MVELVLPFPSSMLGDSCHENASGDLLGSLQPRPSSAHSHELGKGGLESSDVQQQSRLEGYGGGTFLFHNELTAAQDPWFRRSVSEKHMQRRPVLEAMERGSFADVPGREKSAPTNVTQRAHSERLQMVGAVDKTEMRSAVDQEQRALIDKVAEKEVFSEFPFSSMGSRRNMTVSEVQLIQSIGQGVICTDVEGNITHWNRAAEAMYLWKADEVMGQNVVQLLSPKNLRNDSIEVIKRVSRGESWSGPSPAVRSDGLIINTLVTDTPIVDSNNKIIGIIAVVFDVSSLSTAEGTLKRSQSSEDLVNHREKQRAPLTGSDNGENMLSWRRIHLEAENHVEDSVLDPNLSAPASSNILRIGRSSVQELLRKLQIGTRQRQGEFNADREQSWEELGSGRTQSGTSQPVPVGGITDYSQEFEFPVYVPNESRDPDFGKGDSLSIPLVPAKHHGRGEGGSWETYSSQEVIKEVMANSLVTSQMGTFNQTLSRSSSGSAPGSATGRDAHSVGSPSERSLPDNAQNGPGAGLNFQQAEEDFQLQLALALRVASEAAAVDDPDLSTHIRGPKGNMKMMSGISKMEATAYRYWVSCCLTYDDRIEDGFYEVWGMSPYVWSMCTDSSELGRMPPLDNLRAVSPNDATFEVVLVDRNLDHTLSDLEDKAVGLAYESSDVLDMASELSIMVAKVMGGAVASDEELAEPWQAAKTKLMQVLGTIVLPIGLLRVGLSRHRALLFKVLADSVGLACRLVRGSAFCDKEDAASVIVKVGDDKEWMVDLLVNPGTRMAPDKRFTSRPPVIPTPLQFERPNPFAGSSVSVLHWSRGETKDGGSTGGSPKMRNSTDMIPNMGSPRRPNDGDTGPMIITQGLDFLHGEGSKGASSKSRGSYDDGMKGKYGLVDLLDKSRVNQADLKLRSPVAPAGNFFLEDIMKPSDVNDKFPRVGSGNESRQSESPGVDAAREHERGWAREGRRATGSDDSSRSGGPGRMLEHITSDLSDFEIGWEDVVMGERIGQGSYGKVYRADWQGSDVAVKVFLDQDLKTEALEEFKSEVAIMRRLRHPNVVLFMGAVTKPPNLSIITEFCPRGSLYRLLHRPNRELDDRKRIRMAIDVAKGMNYLHRCSPPVVHRDLKSPNLLVDKNWTVKVCDFGLSRQKHSTFLSSKSSAGTPEWMAPEVLRNEPSDEKSDVYSFGVILWELATLQVPWNGMNPIQVVGAVGFQHRRLPIADHIDRGIAGLIQACWRTDTKLRPSFADLMSELKALQQRPLQVQSGQASNTPQTSAGKEEDE